LKGIVHFRSELPHSWKNPSGRKTKALWVFAPPPSFIGGAIAEKTKLKESVMRVGIDVGGTFTDLVMVDEKKGSFHYAKTPTTHYDLAEGVINGLNEILQISGRSVKEIDYLIHGTTIGTNAIIEKKGARVGLITTKGFEDVLEIRRVARPKEAAFDFEVDNPPPLVPKHLRKGIIERINSKGEVFTPLDEDSVREAVSFLQKEKVEAIVISLLFSFLNPRHEQRVAEICREIFPEVLISLSSEISPEFREYERTCTTVERIPWACH
jgi:N-methylhydantoinase A